MISKKIDFDKSENLTGYESDLHFYGEFIFPIVFPAFDILKLVRSSNIQPCFHSSPQIQGLAADSFLSCERTTRDLFEPPTLLPFFFQIPLFFPYSEVSTRFLSLRIQEN